MSVEKELLRPVEEHELPPQSKIWKYFWMLMGVLMIILIVTYTLTAYGVMNIIAGKIDSDKVKGDMIESEYVNIVFLEGVYDELEKLYHENEKEFKACLMGNMFDGEYLINSLYLPKIHFQDYDKVVASPCPDESLIVMHSHPQQHCIFSEVDLKSFDKRNKNMLMAVMCFDDRFIFHG